MRYDTEQIRAAARGRWLDILVRAGIPSDTLDRRHHPCPKCGGNDRFSLVDEDAGAVLCRKCFSTGNGDGFAAVAWSMGGTFPEAMAFVADCLGIGPGEAPKLDPIASVEHAKRIPSGWLAKYGATVINGAVIVPMHDHAGKRCSEQTLDCTGKGLYTKGKPTGLFLPHEAGKVRTPQPGEKWAIVEGVKDAAALASLGYNVAGLPSSAMGLKFVRLFRGCDIILVPDRDKAGDEGAAKSNAVLHGHAASVRIAALDAAWKETDGDGVREVLKSEDGEARIHAALNCGDIGDDFLDFDKLVPLLDEPPTFPLEALPPALANFSQSVATATQTPLDLAALLSLAVASCTVAKRIEVTVSDSWREQVNLFILSVLEPGNRKSNVFRLATEPLRQWERDERRRIAPEMREHQSRRRILEARIRKMEDQAAKASDGSERNKFTDEAREASDELAELPNIVEPRLIADDATPERIVSMLAEQRGRLAVMSAEGNIFDICRGKYSNNLPSFDVFLKAHAGDDIRSDRVTRQGESVSSPALTLAICTQQEVLREITGDSSFKGRGLLARFLYSIPRSTLGARLVNPPAMDEDASLHYHNIIGTLCRLEAPTDSDGEPTPYLVPLDDSARHELLKFSQWIEPQLAPGGDLNDIQGWASKLVGAVVRIAGVMHAVEHCNEFQWWELPIGKLTVSRAISLGKYFIPHAQVALAAMNCNANLADAEHIVAWIKRHERQEFTKRDLYQQTKNRFVSVDDLDSPLALLVDHNFIRLRRKQEESRPGRPASPLYEVNPEVLAKSEKPEIYPQYPQNSEAGESAGRKRVAI